MPIWRTAGNDLVVGTHTITASVSDHGGLRGSASITITITSAPPPPITLTTRGYVKGGAAGRSDVDRVDQRGRLQNNAPVGTAVPGSSYTDNIGGKGSGIFDYKVRQAGSTTNCSNTSRVTF